MSFWFCCIPTLLRYQKYQRNTSFPWFSFVGGLFFTLVKTNF